MRYFVLFLLIISIAFTSCNDASESCCTKPDAAMDHKDHENKSLASFSGQVTDMSLFNLESEWTNQQGGNIQLSSLGGKVQMVAMIYTGCDYACPRIISDLKRIEESISKYERSDVGIVLVTMDPENDTPEKLKAFGQQNKLDADRWTLLTSPENNILELAALLNVKYKKEGSEISHSNIITVLNKNGEIVHQQEGLGIEPDETVNAIDALLKSI